MSMQSAELLDRCRLVLIAPPDVELSRILAACQGGDIASLIVPQYDLDAARFQSSCELLVEKVQMLGVAVMIAGDTRVADRVRADGVHLDGSATAVGDTVERLQDRMMVGVGGAKTRDDALDLGELRPDYIFFGRFGYDTKPDPHPRNLTLGTWWAEMIEVPCIVMGGSDLGSVADVARTGAEFVALGAAIFSGGEDPADRVAEANRLLDETSRVSGAVP